ncbi:DUF3284 domain-containing protein [Lacticaseibacillus jixianensis]|uniref:DUF3284 domain-containing protein n=1 Tax=Lacticaseibacillus jixianensis TaxID=2486012 RepID=A0ABW4B8H4_9LACO|nr:DUF3284 domain-containing protein [Lacticaseibacillus jixianensis]
MKVTSTVNAPVSFFYQKLIDSVLYDIKHETGQDLTFAQLLGFEYKKSLGARGTLRIKITKLVQNQSYAFDTVAGADTYHTSYQVAGTEDDKTDVIYQENADYGDTIKQRNNQLMMLLIGWSKKRRMKQMWDRVAASYQAGE